MPLNSTYCQSNVFIPCNTRPPQCIIFLANIRVIAHCRVIFVYKIFLFQILLLSAHQDVPYPVVVLGAVLYHNFNLDKFYYCIVMLTVYMLSI
jgi:hypothetical protein